MRCELSENVEKLKKRNLVVTQNTDYFVLLQFFSLVLYYFVSHSMFHLHICQKKKRMPHLHSFVICVTVSKSSEILYKGTDCFIIGTRPRVFHT